jgi:Tat protein translocase TatB subunit
MKCLQAPIEGLLSPVTLELAIFCQPYSKTKKIMDSFFGIGILELVFIVIFALIFLGPERLPQVLRDVIGAIRKIRSLSTDITQQLNQEFGDLAELDPRRQIQQALTEEPKPEKKSASSTSAAKSTSTTKATPTTKSTTPKTGTSTTSASAAKKPTTPASTAKPQSDAAPATASTGTENGSANGVVVAHENGKVAEPSIPAAEAATAGLAPVEDVTPVISHDGVAGDGVAGDGVAGDGVAGDGLVKDGAAGDGRVEGTQPRTEEPAGQISPASAYFAQKAQSEKENGTHSVSGVGDHADSEPETPPLTTLAAESPVAENPVAESPVAEHERDSYTIAPPEFQVQDIRAEDSVAVDLPVELPTETTAKEDAA